MTLLAFFLESAHGPYPRTFREHLRMRRVSYSAPCMSGEPLKDIELGRQYAQLGACRALSEGMDGGDKHYRRHRAADWRARFEIHVGDSHAEILAIGLNAKERLLAGIRNRTAQAVRAAEAERSRLDRLFFGLDEVEITVRRQKLRLAR